MLQFVSAKDSPIFEYAPCTNKEFWRLLFDNHLKPQEDAVHLLDTASDGSVRAMAWLQPVLEQSVIRSIAADVFALELDLEDTATRRTWEFIVFELEPAGEPPPALERTQLNLALLKTTAMMSASHIVGLAQNDIAPGLLSLFDAEALPNTKLTGSAGRDWQLFKGAVPAEMGHRAKSSTLTDFPERVYQGVNAASASEKELQHFLHLISKASPADGARVGQVLKEIVGKQDLLSEEELIGLVNQFHKSRHAAQN